MITVKNLTKTYNHRNAVDKISFSVNKGEILGFLGPNGAGKSTTMKILSGFMSATSGIAEVNGFNVATHSMQARSSIGYLPEIPPVYTGMAVEDYLKFAAELHGVSSSRIKASVNEAMEKCAITDVRSRLIGNLSKGYRQRVGLAQAIAHNPPVLILDEPTVGLDPRQIIEIRNLIQGLAGNHTVILSTHILPEVQATCSRVVVIDHGRVIAQDTLAGIASRMQTFARLTVGLRVNPNKILDKIKNMTGVKSLAVEQSPETSEFHLVIECAKGVDIRSEVAELCVQDRLGLLSLAQEKMSLEDAFVRLINQEEVTKDVETKN